MKLKTKKIGGKSHKLIFRDDDGKILKEHTCLRASGVRYIILKNGKYEDEPRCTYRRKSKTETVKYVKWLRNDDARNGGANQYRYMSPSEVIKSPPIDVVECPCGGVVRVTKKGKVKNHSPKCAGVERWHDRICPHSGETVELRVD